MRMAYITRTVALFATVLVTVAGCASSATPSSPTASGKAEFSASAGKPLTITPNRMLAATGGVTPVAFGKPAHGKIGYGPHGAVVYTPDAGFKGNDELPVTVSRAVKLYSEDQLPLATIGGVDIQASAHGSGIAPVPGSSDEIYGLTDRGP
ncbi:MAG: esterase-like activity of phytase family protein, partial [Mycobacterium gordonae]|nr:esterase-like activity of phytase family protein [Mycobacterium gordonae]